MPPTGSLRSPTGARIMPSPYQNITFSAPVAAPGDDAPAALVEFAGRLVGNYLNTDRMAARLERHAEGVARRRAESVQAQSQFQPSLMREARAEQDTP